MPTTPRPEGSLAVEVSDEQVDAVQRDGFTSFPRITIDDDPTVHGLIAHDVDPDDPAVRAAAVPVPLMAGGATFHHPRTLHTTGANLTDRRRRAFATEFQTTPVTASGGPERPWVDEGR